MTIKSERVAELIMAHISQMLLVELRDPRLAGVTITEVNLDRELEHAEIFVNALGDEEREKDVLAAFRSAQGFIRKELGTRLRIRRVPLLHFKWDKRLEIAVHMDSVLDALKTKPAISPAPTPDDDDEDLDDEQ
jgi:ribosome-binding factor A